MAGRRPFRFAGVSGKDGFLRCVGSRAGPGRALRVCRHREMRGGREASEWGSFSGRGLLAWAGVTGFRRLAFRCSTGPGPASGVGGLRAHDVGRATGRTSGRQIYVTRGYLVVPGPGGDECGWRLSMNGTMGRAATVLTAASAVGFVLGRDCVRQRPAWGGLPRWGGFPFVVLVRVRTLETQGGRGAAHDDRGTS